MPFLPRDYEPPVTGKYLKFTNGPNRFRILGPAVLGWEYWKTLPDGARRPVRLPIAERVNPAELGINPSDGEREKIKHFWLVAVYNPLARAVQVLEITQVTIQDGIRAITENEDWGDPSELPGGFAGVHGYDLVVTKTVKGEKTSYAVTPCPKKALPPEVLAEIAATPVHLEALLAGGDPFAPPGSTPGPGSTPPTRGGWAEPLEQAGTVDVCIEDVREKVVGLKAGGTARIFSIDTDKGTFGTLDPGVGEQLLKENRSGRPVRLKWTLDPRGRRVDAIVPIPPPPPEVSPVAAGAAGTPGVDEEQIPF